MRALVFTAPNTVELHNVPEPVVEAGETLIDVHAVGICGSELHGIATTDFRKPPLIMGHELAGLADGRRVTVNPLLSCETCDRCAGGEEHLCRERQILGIHRPGAFAERVAVPLSAVREIPDDMSFAAAAVIEPLANAVHALRLAAPTGAPRIAVLGAGTIGLCSLLVARQYSDQVDICDLAEDRLAIAGRLGARTAATHLSGEYDVVIDAVGAAVTHRLSVDLLRPGGTAVWVGLLSQDAAFDGQEIVRFEKRVIGSYCYRREDFDEALRLASKVDLGWTSSFALDDGATIFAELLNGRRDVLKALLHPVELDD